jgi:hypothetical protein
VDAVPCDGPTGNDEGADPNRGECGRAETMPGVHASLDLARADSGDKRQNDDGGHADPDALIWHRRPRGPRGWPPAAWGSLLLIVHRISPGRRAGGWSLCVAAVRAVRWRAIRSQGLLPMVGVRSRSYPER